MDALSPAVIWARAVLLLRILLVSLALLVVVASEAGPDLVRLMWLGALALVALTRPRSWTRPVPLWRLVIESAACGVGIAVTGGATSALLPLLLGPALEAGTVTLSWLGLVLTAQATALVVTSVVVHQPSGVPLVSAQWLLLAAGVGGFAHVTRLREQTDRYGEAVDLLEQLRELTRRLPTGLDPATTAQALLSRCAELVPVRVATVLQRTADDRLVPLALHGARRVPWTRPLDEPGPLATAWSEHRVVREARDVDVSGGHRKSSDLLVVPMQGSREWLGMLVIDSADRLAFEDPAVIDLVIAEAVKATPALEVGLSFEELRSRARADERTRLAAEMHDGIAQRVAALGFSVDLLRRRLERDTPVLAGDLVELRSRINEMIGDVRLTMIDLSSSVSPERGLARALTDYLQSVAFATGIRVHTDIKVTGFRLVGEVEQAIYRLVNDCITPLPELGVRELWVSLALEAPTARLELACEAPDVWTDDLVARWRRDLSVDESIGVTLDGYGGRQSRLLISIGEVAWPSGSPSSTITR